MDHDVDFYTLLQRAIEAGKPGDIRLASGNRMDGVVIEEIYNQFVVVRESSGVQRWSIPIEKIEGVSHVAKGLVEKSQYHDGSSLMTMSANDQNGSALQRLGGGMIG